MEKSGSLGGHSRRNARACKEDLRRAPPDGAGRRRGASRRRRRGKAVGSRGGRRHVVIGDGGAALDPRARGVVDRPISRPLLCVPREAQVPSLSEAAHHCISESLASSFNCRQGAEAVRCGARERGA